MSEASKALERFVDEGSVTVYGPEDIPTTLAFMAETHDCDRNVWVRLAFGHRLKPAERSRVIEAAARYGFLLAEEVTSHDGRT